MLIVEQNAVIPANCATRVVVLENSEIVMQGDRGSARDQSSWVDWRRYANL